LQPAGTFKAQAMEASQTPTVTVVREPAIARGERTGTVYETIRQDIVEGRLPAGARLNVNVLATRYGTSTNPVREALQQLRGEGFVLFSPNRGARVRPIDADFVRDVYEVTALLEPYMTRWFVGYVTDDHIVRLEAIQDEIETTGFEIPEAYSRLDERFHRIAYDAHYNRHAVDMWWRHREILRAIGRRFPFSRARRKAILIEHRGLIDCFKRQDTEGAAELIRIHVEGSGRHLIGHMRAGANGGVRTES
jgi:DNA-binding GntR family transcriptional regulator